VQIQVQIKVYFGSISRDVESEIFPIFIGGEGEIRTHEPLAGLPVFKTGAFNRSATSPNRQALLFCLTTIAFSGLLGNSHGSAIPLGRGQRLDRCTPPDYSSLDPAAELNRQGATPIVLVISYRSVSHISNSALLHGR
jgi:hypothetical protein